MTFTEMGQLEPELQRLAASAENAGQHQAKWWPTWLAMSEPLSKIVGRGAAHEALQDARAYEVARAGLYASWAKGRKTGSVAAPVEVEQSTVFDTSDAYT